MPMVKYSHLPFSNFTVILYDKTSDLEHVNEARKVLFARWKKLPGCFVAAQQVST